MRSSVPIIVTMLVFAGAAGCASDSDDARTSTTTSTKAAASGVEGVVEGYGKIVIAVTAPDGSNTLDTLCARGNDFFTDCSVRSVAQGGTVVVHVEGEDTRDERSLKGWSIEGAGRTATACARSAAATCSFTMPDGRVRVSARFTANNRAGGPVPAPSVTGPQ